MDDELPSRGREKLNKIIKISLVLASGLFFSVHFEIINSPSINAANNRMETASVKVHAVNSPVKVVIFKFDPMEKVRSSVGQIESAKQREQKKQLEKKEKDKKPKNGQEQKYQELIQGSPLEKMLPYIARWDHETAAFLIAIAKKESDWGKHSPKKEGGDCFNYWGYRGTYNQTDSGYSCFDSPEQAISVVGERIQELIAKKINTAEKMVVWKCGSTCAGHDPAGVRKWISDVALYYGKANS
jgi:hypothetical protein